MRKIALALVLAGLAAPAVAREPKAYQVTGPVVEVGDGTVTVEKGGKEKFEIALPSDVQGASELKKGDRVTIHYRMTATSVEAKPAKAAGGAAKKK